MRTGRRTRRGVSAGLAVLGMLATAVVAGAPAGEAQPDDSFTLTVLHNNDGESQLINAGSELEDFGGVARFATVLNEARAQAQQGRGAGGIFVSSGDNFLAGPEFTAGLEKGVPFFDTIALDALDYDAISFGNHDFDFGPDVLADFLSGYTKMPPYLGANVDFSGEPSLQAFVDAGDVAASTVVKVKGEEIGIVGALTPALPAISSPGDVIVDPDVAGAIQAEVDALGAAGVDNVVLISHLQSVQEDLALAPMLDDVDVMVAGGGDEVLANPGDLLVPGDVAVGSYPLVATDSDGTQVPVVTTAGNYKYLGRLAVDFDGEGNVIGWEGGPIRVAGGDNPDAVKPSGKLQARVVRPVSDFVTALDEQVIGTSEVALDGTRVNIRTTETNEGNLIADALLSQATELAPGEGQPVPDVALQNGGGIRNDDVRGPGPITLLDTFDMVPFSNFVSVVPDIPREQFKEMLENAVSRVELVDGRFAQVAGFSFTWDANGTPQELDADGNVLTPGTRVVEATLDDGTPIVDNGAVVPGDDLTIATIDFLARGMDGYPFRGAPFTNLAVSYQQALVNYITDGLGGLITAADYPEGGEGRITRLN
ncbi:MAG TPA: bifunctional metallophosphatase/5'-nucleotidase [Acidimicrobiales bacterium]|nr:bifunctional metallophosphatase/5'-nucleotidase [Acidimicrobiales bacterium]